MIQYEPKWRVYCHINAVGAAVNWSTEGWKTLYEGESEEEMITAFKETLDMWEWIGEYLPVYVDHNSTRYMTLYLFFDA